MLALINSTSLGQPKQQSVSFPPSHQIPCNNFLPTITMAARSPSEAATSTALSVAAVSEDDDPSTGIVSMDDYTFDQIVEHIVDAYHGRTESKSILSWRCPPDVAWDLSTRLNEALIVRDEPAIHRLKYDGPSGITYIDIMPESNMRSQFLSRARNHMEICLSRKPDASVESMDTPRDLQRRHDELVKDIKAAHKKFAPSSSFDAPFWSNKAHLLAMDSERIGLYNAIQFHKYQEEGGTPSRERWEEVDPKARECIGEQVALVM